MDVPSRLYKYRAFNVNSLRLLSEGEVYYANPQSFNDPLDCDPTLNIDIDRDALEELCFQLLKNSEDEDSARKRIDHHWYMSTEHGGDKTEDAKVESNYMRMLATDVKRILVDDYGKMGVFSLASNWDCPLMWSHDANEHHGVCIEYDSSDAEFRNVAPVRYDRPRSIRISELAAWKLRDCERSKESVFQTFFLSKSPQWKYEAEWRDIADRNGVQAAPVLIKSVYFGLRCDPAVRTSVVKLLSRTDVTFYDIYPRRDSFDLARREVDADEIEACGVRSSVIFDFRDVVSNT